MEDIEKEEVDVDEMKMKLSTKFMKNVLSKLISKALYKKLGYKIDIRLNDINVEFIDGETNIHADVDLKLDKEEFTKIIKSSDLDWAGNGSFFLFAKFTLRIMKENISEHKNDKL